MCFAITILEFKLGYNPEKRTGLKLIDCILSFDDQADGHRLHPPG